MSDIDAYLGDFAGDLTDDQKADLVRAFKAIDERYPLDDDGQDDWLDERTDAKAGAAMVAFGDETPESLVAAWRVSASVERVAMARLTGALNLAALTRTENGLSADLDLNRMTVRKALGKR